MKNLILGCVGAGKTTLAEKLFKKFKLPFISSDDIIFDEKWQRRNLDDVNLQLKFFNKNNSWTFEGVKSKYFIRKKNISFDILVLLNCPKKVILRRIIRRFKEGKRGKNSYGKLKSFIPLLFWTILYSPKKNFEFIKSFKGSVFVLGNEADEKTFLKKLESKAFI